eukprot:Gregarina_sp_Poly_1__3691@NODE_208_length_11377_cov_32_000884_g185_i0_p3_GENE_NODE_208_length_11377_cov_32_000884_g185_i0NODE_208_length_11377_cov_32_000884_g185_i0_p3_ORF_typecomplete_len639_score73_54ABC_ATPase/PF09818_9/1e153AAA_23/PF13476_6/1_1e04AAA_23/PF13476_6/0_00012AAA_29/PF13555_6/0_0068AAA_27/PF13514_6/0_45_NODE_208_length_11377_cov_32_000884_g185_i044196335
MQTSLMVGTWRVNRPRCRVIREVWNHSKLPFFAPEIWAQMSPPRGRRGVPYTHGGEDSSSLDEALLNLEGASYQGYRTLQNKTFTVPVPRASGYVSVTFDRIQGDSFAPPSHLRFRVPVSVDPKWRSTETHVTAVQDFLTRRLNTHLEIPFSTRRGVGSWHAPKGGKFTVYTPGQNVLDRSTVILAPDWIEARVRFGLPARGRTIEGRRCADLLCRQAIPLMYSVLNLNLLNGHDQQDLERYVQNIENQECLRNHLKSANLVAFVPNGASLPRRSGFEDTPLRLANNQSEEYDSSSEFGTTDDLPASHSRLVLFESPPSLRVTLPLADGSTISGMGIPPGVTILTGGGFNGKTTLLEALQFGIYNKVPKDGREFVSTVPNTAKIQAEGGRRVSRLDISAFIRELPLGIDVRHFSTENASGSTSQAANIVEAVEAGAELLLIDEDTSATNLLQRDEVMNLVVSREMEPICSFLSLVRSLYEDRGVSTIIVVGSCGAFFHVADRVIQMHSYRPYDITAKAKAIVQRIPSHIPQNRFPMKLPRRIIDQAPLLVPPKARWVRKILTRGSMVLLPVHYLDQIVEEGQLQGVIHAFNCLGVKGVSGVGIVETAEEASRIVRARCQADSIYSGINSYEGNLASLP